MRIAITSCYCCLPALSTYKVIEYYANFHIDLDTTSHDIYIDLVVRIQYALLTEGALVKLSTVIIGLGNQSLSEHIPALLRRNDIRIIGGYDPNPEAHSNFKKAHPELYGTIPTYDNLQELLDKTRPRIAIVAVPHDSYTANIAELCKRHIYFLKEKPMARNLDEAKKLLAYPGFDQYGFIAAQRRYGKLYQKAKESISSIGQPYMFNAVYKLNIESPHSGWRGRKASAGGGCLIDMGYHIIDQLLWWFGMPEKLNAQISSLAITNGNYDAEDSATVSFQYSNGMHGTLLISRAAGEKTEGYEVYGPNGYIEGSKKRLSIHDRQGHLLSQIDASETDSMIDAQLGFFISRVEAMKGFSDIQGQHLENMQFIERCYQNALGNNKTTE